MVSACGEENMNTGYTNGRIVKKHTHKQQVNTNPVIEVMLLKQNTNNRKESEERSCIPICLIVMKYFFD
jgi:hypothetical protein